MNLIHWANGAWANGTWVPTSWGVSKVGGHFGGKKRKHKPDEERFKELREERERIREQIRLAIDGPEAPQIAVHIQPFAQPGERHIAERIDLDELIRQSDVLVAVREAADREADRRRLEREEEDDVMVIAASLH